MMWYDTREKAQEACVRYEKEYGYRFYVLKDSEDEDMYWAQRKIPTEYFSE